MNLKTRVVAVSAIFCGFFFLHSTNVGHAVNITFNFQGVVTGYSSNTSSSTMAAIPVGSSVVGSYTFDSNTPDTDPGDPTNGDYDYALSALNFSVNGGTAVTLDPNATQNYILVDDTTIVGDAYFVAADMVGDAAPGISSDLFSIVLTDGVGTAFSSDALPLTPPSLLDFPATPDSIFFVLNQAEFVEFRLTSLTLVPEPTTAALLVGGLCLGLCRRKRNEGSSM